MTHKESKTEQDYLNSIKAFQSYILINEEEIVKLENKIKELTEHLSEKINNHKNAIKILQNGINKDLIYIKELKNEIKWNSKYWRIKWTN